VIAARFGDVPTKPGEVREIRSNQILVAALTPDEFLILTQPSIEKEWTTSLETEIASQGSFMSVIDLTSGLVGLSISGPRSVEVNRKLCALPFNSREFPNLSVAQSSFAHVRTTIIRHDQDGSPAFELFADRSYSEYLWDTILDAGKEFGMRPVGWGVLGNFYR
jgi:heterotetrameric sarcosine oxidase gamma subunit